MKSSKSLVTIVTVVFDLIKSGRGKFFRQCLESVHNQTYENIEHIVVDGKSTDGTVNLIKEYAKKNWIKYISEPDTGIYNAMNKGIKMAKGKYIAFLNSDDFYHNKKAVELSVSALEKNNADFSYADFLMIKNEDNVEKIHWGIEKFLYMMPFGHPTMFSKVSVIKSYGGFNESYKVAADYDLVIKLILNDYKGVFVDADIVSYRYGGVCCSSDYSQEIAKIYKENYSCFFNFLNLEQARKIMYDRRIPYGFSSGFREYAKKKKIKNINVDEVLLALLTDRFECEEKNSEEDLNPLQGIPVFLSADNNYAPFVATTIASIMDHTKSYINFYVLDGGITIDNVRKIKDLRKRFSNFSIEFIEINTCEKFNNFPTRLHFSLTMYTRFLIPALKPNLKKVIYSDVDVIFDKDIKNLFEEDLEGFPIGAVPFTYGYIYPFQKEVKSYHRRLNISLDHQYFESGLLLLDVKSWIKNDFCNKLLKEVKRMSPEKILTPDQDVFNLVFENNYKKLDNKYIVDPNRKNIMQTEINAMKSIENPFIIHFAGPKKPWQNPELPMADYFWKYAKMTSFYEELIYNLIKINLLVVREQKRTDDICPEIFNKEKKLKIIKLKNKIIFLVFSPNKFFKKYFYKFLNSPLRQPARRVWYWLRGKKIKIN